MKKLIVIILFLSLYLNWFTIDNQFLQFTYSNLNLVPKWIYGLVDLLSFSAFIYLYFSYKYKFYDSGLLLFIFFFLLLSSIITLLYQGSFVNIIIGIRNNLSFLPMFYLGAYFFSKNYDIEKVLKYYLLFTFFQLPLVIYQYIRASQLIGVYPGTVYDLVNGSFGAYANNVLSAYLISVIFFLINKYLIFVEKKYLIISLFFLIPTFLAEGKSTILYLISTSFSLSVLLKDRIFNKIKLITISFGLLILFLSMYGIYTQNEFNFFNIDALKNYETSYSINQRLSRTESFFKSFEKISAEPLSLIFGFGIGNASNNNFNDSKAKYDNFYEIRHYYDKLILEFGIFGIFLYSFSFIYLFNRFYNLYKSTNELKIKFLALGFLSTIIIMITGNLIVDLLNRPQYSYSFYFFCGYLFEASKAKIKSLENV